MLGGACGGCVAFMAGSTQEGYGDEILQKVLFNEGLILMYSES